MIKPSIFQINVSPGGVPKLPVRSAEVTALELVGDAHNNNVVHGGPTRAVCLYSLERILALQAEGHPIFPGATGENVTLAGVDWDAVVPGVRLQAGRHRRNRDHAVHRAVPQDHGVVRRWRHPPDAAGGAPRLVARLRQRAHDG